MRKTVEDKKITELSLVKSALTLFLLHGYSNVSVEQISKQANVTRGAFYWHFKSKKEILTRILHMNRKKLIDFLHIQFNQSNENHFLKAKSILNNVIENFWFDNDFRDFIQLTWFKLEDQFSNDSLEYKLVVNDFFVDEFAKIIEDGQQNNTINSEYSAQQYSLHATALINGIYRMYFVSSQFSKIDEAKAMINTFCNGLKN